MEEREEENKILKEKEFNLISDKNNEYRIKVFITNNELFCINLFTNNNVPSKKYSISLSMNDLIKNRFFKIFIDLDEVFRELENKIESSNIIEDTNLLYLDIPIGLNIINDIILEIKESQISKDEIINELQNELNHKNILIKQIQLQNKELEKKLKENEIILNQKIKKLEDIINQYQEKEKEKEKLISFNGTNILENESKKMLLDWLPRKPIKLTLLLNSNIDGDSTTTFMNKCKGKCPTLAVIKTTKGYIFGGYTTQLWKEGEVKDQNAFVFSIDKKKKYNIKLPEHATGFGTNSWWGFGYSYNAIIILDNCHQTNGNWVNNKTYDIPEPYELNGGEKYFTVKSFEIYHVEY